MKFIYVVCLTLACYVALVLSTAKDDFEKILKSCRQDVPINDNDLRTLNSSPNDVSEAVKCYMKCVMEKQGHFKNGMLLEEAVIESLQSSPDGQNDQNQMFAAVHECKTEKGTNECDTAFKVSMCLRENKVDFEI
uniref:Uncharacterized protein n=1 Tax=Glossina brevipalpis TaxID=37001 RepID=A0A1A9X127_9MUSC